MIQLKSPREIDAMAQGGRILAGTLDPAELAEKLQTIYDIPADKVGVSYVDNDNDEITASSQEELQDYYQASRQPGSAVKFTVWDLSVPRGSPVAAAPSANRNTFGADNFDYVVEAEALLADA